LQGVKATPPPEFITLRLFLLACRENVCYLGQE
jgi:hypothetical protein